MRRSTVPALALLALPLLAGGCPSREKLGASTLAILGSGVVNDPRNKSLRFDVLRFGLETFCREMTKVGVPLRTQDDSPPQGRFFADSCTTQILDDESRKSLVVQFSGKGYAYSALTRRAGFHFGGVLEYAPDFQMHEGAMYVYFRPRNIGSVAFELKMVEPSMASAGAVVFGDAVWKKGEAMAQQVARSQLRRGFTVIRYTSQGETEFGMGYIPLGLRPHRPFQVRGGERTVLANDTTELHPQQQDLIGAFEVLEDDEGLYFDLRVDGAPMVDVAVVSKSVGDAWVEKLVMTQGPAEPIAPPVVEEPLAQGGMYRRFLKVPRGQWYLVLDHSSAFGPTAAPPVGQGPAARVEYLVQRGEAP